jgi:hypothetical protein
MAEEIKENIKSMTLRTPLEREGFLSCIKVDEIEKQHKEDPIKQSILFLDEMVNIAKKVMEYKTRERILHTARQASVMLNRNRPFALKR